MSHLVERGWHTRLPSNNNNNNANININNTNNNFNNSSSTYDVQYPRDTNLIPRGASPAAIDRCTASKAIS